ncbi:uncharacterized protein LOC115363086 [Myripristis murdjan]|uniref:uncharacterized protein LOC115363086 n=1 Tax=Myripristis murdjan TaxID=586833 RepID=UPI00117627CD|nr:uncharacterized protein LOC115363086 [Myripristis murdjan]
MAPVPSGSNQTGSSVAKTSFRSRRSNTAGGSVGGRGGDWRAPGSKVGSTLHRGIVSHNSCVGHQGTRQASNPARAALRLCSSRSSPSLHTSSLSAAPFMRSCRSLCRLDRSPIRDETGSGHTVLRSLLNTGPSSLEKTALESGQPTSPAATQEPCRDAKDHGENDEKMETSSSSDPPASSSCVVSSAACHQHSDKLKKQELSQDSAVQLPDASRLSLPRRLRSKSLDCRDDESSVITKDGVYTLCAMTSGIRHNWIQAVLENVGPTLTPDMASSLLEENTRLTSQRPDSRPAEVVRDTAHEKSCVRDGCGEGQDKTFDGLSGILHIWRRRDNRVEMLPVISIRSLLEKHKQLA